MIKFEPRKFFLHGTIARLNNGYGFITRANTPKDIFFHVMELVDAEFSTLEEGTEVGFEVINGIKGPNAVNVTTNWQMPDEGPEDEETGNDLANGIGADVLVAVKSFIQRLIEAVAKNPDALNEIEWRDLERMLAEAFAGLGFSVELTPESKDGGRDLELRYQGSGQEKTVFVELKHWRSGKRVGRQPVSEFLHVIATERPSSGLFLSTSGFSKSTFECYTEFDRSLVGFGTNEKVVSLCRNYIRAAGGLWFPPDELAQAVYEHTIYPFT